MLIDDNRQVTTLEQNVIDIQNLEFSYGRNRTVDKLSFFIGKGEILGLIGKNGAGKTTIIHLLLGLLTYRKGKIRIIGLDPKHENIKILARCGFFPEQGEPYHWMRIETLFKMGQYSYNSWDRNLCDKLSNQLELDKRKRISELSKGMLVKTKLIFALAHQPEVLLLDEPTNGLDPLSRYDVLNLIKSLSIQQKVTVLISSHNLEEVAEVASKICIIDKGKELLSDSMSAIQSEYILMESSAEFVVPDSFNRLVVVSRKDDDKIQYLVPNRNDPAVIDFASHCGKDDVRFRKLSLKELFVFITTRKLV